MALTALAPQGTTIDLGSLTNKWDNLYVNTINADTVNWDEVNIISDNTTTDVFSIAAASLTTGDAINIQDVGLDALVSGSAINIKGNSASYSGAGYIKIHNDNPSSTGDLMLLTQDSTNGDALVINHNGNNNSIFITSAATSNSVVNIDGANTTGDILDVTGNALITGSVARFEANSEFCVTGTGIVEVIQNHASATGIALYVQQDGNSTGLKVWSNATTNTSGAINLVSSTLTSGIGINSIMSSASFSGSNLFLGSVDSSSTGTMISIDHNGNGKSIFIDSESTSVSVIHIDAATTTGEVLDIDTLSTTGDVISVIANSLTTGSGLLLSSSNTAFIGSTASGLATINITGATASATGLYILNDGTGENVFLKTTNAAGRSLDISATGVTTGTPVFMDFGALTTGGGAFLNCTSTSYTGSQGILQVTASQSASSGLVAFFDNAGTGDTINARATSSSFSGDILEIWASHASNTGRGIFINQDGNGKSLQIDSEATTATVVEIDGDALTSGIALNVSADAKTSGNIMTANTTSAAFTGTVLGLSATGASNTGTLIALTQTQSTGKALNITQNARTVIVVEDSGNLSLAGGNGENYQSGTSIIYIGNRIAAPTGNPSGGGFVYAESGELIWRSSSGFITKIASDFCELELDPTPDTDHSVSGIGATETVDANSVGIGGALHLDTDGNYINADADAVTTMPCQALALESGTGTKKVLLQGYMRDDSWNWTVGGLLYISTTTGTLTQTAPSGTGDQVQVVGVATHADRMYFNPNYAMVEVA